MFHSVATVSGLPGSTAIFGAAPTGPTTPSAGPAAPSGASTSFGDLMAQFASTAKDTVKAGEAAAISGIQGKASTQSVVEAVMSAEQALQTAIAIRDKVVAAYQEVIRMAI